MKSQIEYILKTSRSKLSFKEVSFLESIKDKESLTQKQADWFCDIAKKCGRHINVFNLKIKAPAAKKTRKTCKTTSVCRHEDLGSLGYTHGSWVICPNCGKRAQVW